MTKLLTLFLLAIGLCLGGCSARMAQVRGIGPLNRNDDGESTPVDVRFYLLRDQDSFQRASFEALWTAPSQALGASLICPPVVATVLPGEAGDAPRIIDLGDESSGASWIGIQVLARRGDGTPRTLLVEADRLPLDVIEIAGSGVRLAGSKP